MNSTFDYSLSTQIRADFPIFKASNLVYLDSAASAQKPLAVIEALNDFYKNSYANIHRGLYSLSEEATRKYEDARSKIAQFVNCQTEEVIFTHGATESINLIAYAWGRKQLKAGDEIVVSVLEHHANFVPWQLVAQDTGVVIRYVSLDEELRFDLQEFKRILNSKTKLVAITGLSNAIGIIPPLEEVIREAHLYGACVMLDAAQSVAHGFLDVQKIGADFVAFSGHKLYGPTGIGVLVAKRHRWAEMTPFITGGDIIEAVTLDGTTFKQAPYCFEAGTPHIAGAIGLAAAIDYLRELGWEGLKKLESCILSVLEDGLQRLSGQGVYIHGPRGGHHGVLSFSVDGVHAHDIAQYLSQENIAVRAGHHCAQPLMTVLEKPATTRMSVGIYNTPEDAEKAVSAVEKALRYFR